MERLQEEVRARRNPGWRTQAEYHRGVLEDLLAEKAEAKAAKEAERKSAASAKHY